MPPDSIYTLWRSPFGWIGLAASTRGMVAITSPYASRRAALSGLRETVNVGQIGENGFIRATCRLLERYFTGDSRVDLGQVQLDMQHGTPFQRRVWQELRQIPYGETRTYREIACAVGRPNAARAIGQCNARNPWAIIVPCHRVVGSNATLTGYASGIEMKRRLLELEGIDLTALFATMPAAVSKRRDIYAHRD